MNFKQLYITGMLNLQEEKNKKDNTGEKRYRGGNAGILHNGMPANSCARKLIARSEGRFEQTAWNTQLMFDLGELNEVRWHDKLIAAGLDAQSADDLVKTSTVGGIPITGSPDTLIVKDKEHQYLIEHKHISSFWTFRDKVIEGKPSLEHIAQAGFYSMNLDPMPFCVLYTSSVKFSGPSFLTNLVPKPTEPGSENFEYTYYYFTGKMKTYKGKQSKEKKKLVVPGHLQGEYPHTLFNSLGADFAEFKNTIPTVVQFDLKWNEDGSISYQKTGTKGWTKTIVTKQTIMDFYNYTEQAEKDKKLPKRPLTLDASGESKGFNSCDYCSLSEVCDKYENSGFDEWLKQSKLVTW